MSEPLDLLRERFPESEGWTHVVMRGDAVTVVEVVHHPSHVGFGGGGATLRGAIKSLIAAWDAAQQADPKWQERERKVKALVEAALSLRERVAEVLRSDLRIGGDPHEEPALHDEHKPYHYTLTGLSSTLDRALAAFDGEGTSGRGQQSVCEPTSSVAPRQEGGAALDGEPIHQGDLHRTLPPGPIAAARATEVAAKEQA